MILVTFLLIVTVKVTSCNILDVCQIVNPCYSIFLKRFVLLMLSLVAFFNFIIFLDLFRKKCPPKTFILPRILPFHGSMPSGPEAIEIPTISSNIQQNLPNVQQSENVEHVKFSTGFITIIIFTMTSVIVSRVVQHFSSKSSFFLPSSTGYIISIIITTIIPVYWTWANEDLQEFSKRYVKKKLSL